MSQTVEAIYDGAVLRPETSLNLEANTRVRLTFEVIPTDTMPPTFLRIARSLNLGGPTDWSAKHDNYFYRDDRPQ